MTARTKTKQSTDAEGASASQPRRGRPRTDGRAPITREDILMAAWRTLALSSVGGTSVKDIADELGCHTASIFHHFPTKQALVTAVAVKVFSQELEWIRAIEALGAPADVTLFRIVHDDAYFGSSGPAQVRSVFLSPELRNGGAPEMDALMSEYEGRLRAIIDAGVVGGLFQDMDSSAAADCLNALGMAGVIKWNLAEGASAKALALIAARIALGGLLLDPGRLSAIEAEALALKVRRAPSTE